MSQKKILKRSKIKPFIKVLNFNHLMPTRYTINDLDVKSSVKPEAVAKPAGKTEALKSVKKVFEERYLTKAKSAGGAQYFFKKLRF
jgi:large subunit ribosomal protein L27e